MIKAIIFDCFGVLTTDIGTSFIDRIKNEDDKREYLDIKTQLDARLIDFEDYSKKSYELLGEYPPDIRLVQYPVKNEEIFEEISKLKELNYKIGMISNISSNWVTSVFLESKDQSLFDNMIFSFEVGLAKPDKSIYELALQELDVSAEQAIFIDDNKGYCDAAKKVGMNTIHFIDNRSTIKQLNKLIKG